MSSDGCQVPKISEEAKKKAYKKIMEMSLVRYQEEKQAMKNLNEAKDFNEAKDLGDWERVDKLTPEELEELVKYRKVWRFKKFIQRKFPKFLVSQNVTKDPKKHLQ